MNALLASLKLVNAKRQSHADPIEFRRQKLIRKIDEQIMLCEAVQNGTTYVVDRQRKVIDEVTGDVRFITVERKVRPMWFTSANGKKVLHRWAVCGIIAAISEMNFALGIDDEITP